VVRYSTTTQQSFQPLSGLQLKKSEYDVLKYCYFLQFCFFPFCRLFKLVFISSNLWLLCVSGDLNHWSTDCNIASAVIHVHNSQRVGKCTSSPLYTHFSVCHVCFLLLNSVLLLLNLQVFSVPLSKNFSYYSVDILRCDTDIDMLLLN